MNRMINKAELHEAIVEAAKSCAKRIVNASWEEAEAERRVCEANDGHSVECEERAVKAWNALMKRGLTSMKQLAELAGRVASEEEGGLSLSEVICEAFVW